MDCLGTDCVCEAYTVQNGVVAHHFCKFSDRFPSGDFGALSCWTFLRWSWCFVVSPSCVTYLDRYRSVRLSLSHVCLTIILCVLLLEYTKKIVLLLSGESSGIGRRS